MNSGYREQLSLFPVFVREERYLMPERAKVRKTGSVSRLREILRILRDFDIVRGLTPEKLRLLFEALGPTFVKLGQIMSMRSDMLPRNYCTELKKLRSSVAPMPTDEVKRLLFREYGENWHDIFAEVSEQPLGSASIAQVHTAVLSDGKSVVIKVRRPMVREIMAKDILFLKRAVKLLKMVPRLGDAVDFNMLIDEMWAVARQEMDFITEAGHLEKFRELNEHERYVSCPQVYKELSTSGILVMEYIRGIPIDEVSLITDTGFDINEIGKRLAGNYIKQILDDGFFHADPHPGNIRVHDGNIVWIDLGMMGVLSTRDRDLFKRAALSIVNKDVYELETALLSIGITNKKISHTELYEDINLFLMKYGSTNLSELELGKTMAELLEIAKRHDIGMPPGVTMLGRGIMTMEGVMSYICPGANFIQILADRYSEISLKQVDFYKSAVSAFNAIRSAAGKLSETPVYLADMLKMAVRGQSKLNLEFIGSEEPLRKLSGIMNRLIIGIIDAALILSSSLICLTDMQPQILDIPLPGFIGFTAAVLLGIWLIIGFGKNK
ncbi:MAG: AarF/UbiB family protein [Oscillospiraceae bacterium]|nr:AarF/UbiB family protein [Oscillospiraceae bacterium]